MKQTAVEWIDSMIWVGCTVINKGNDVLICKEKLSEFINQAKEIENQQQGYSEEEIKFQANLLLNNFIYTCGFSTNTIGGIVNEWFNQFKKK